MFFHLGEQDNSTCLCTDTRFKAVEQHRITTTTDYADADGACNAAFIGGPVALAWSRFDETARQRARARYLRAISPWQDCRGYHLPAPFVIAIGAAPM
ncbi:MAG: hypothetical protein ABI843_03795 [Dokdonella sp.]